MAGTEPDLPDEVAWWQADDFWQYALFAAVAIRAAASRAACRYARHARTWLGALATPRHNDHFGTQWKQPLDGGAADHNGGDVRVALDLLPHSA